MSERAYQLAGWILFVISAFGFIASSLRSGDLWGLAGGLFFLVSCIVFLIPFFRRPPVRRASERSRSDSR